MFCRMLQKNVSSEKLEQFVRTVELSGSQAVIFRACPECGGNNLGCYLDTAEWHCHFCGHRWKGVTSGEAFKELQRIEEDEKQKC